jgi:hypothetical protein
MVLHEKEFPSSGGVYFSAGKRPIGYSSHKQKNPFNKLKGFSFENMNVLSALNSFTEQ